MAACAWCDTTFTPRNGGKTQRFCSTDCRTDYFAACRAWGEHEHREGLWSYRDAEKRTGATCTFA